MLAITAALLLQAAPAAGGKGAPSNAPAPHPEVMANPDWVRRPSDEDLMRYLPDRAQRAGVEGRVTMACVVTDKGQLADCAVIEESPINYGFGDAAVRLGKLFKTRLQTRDGQLVAGGTVRIPIRFALPGRLDPLSALYACYGETAAAAERDPANAEANHAFAVLAAQVGLRLAEGKATPEALESGLTDARTAALARRGPPTSGPTLASCLALARKPAP